MRRRYDDELKKQLGITYTEGGGKSLLDLINQPSLNIDGIKSGDVGTQGPQHHSIKSERRSWI
jgi:hypothetical protein